MPTDRGCVMDERTSLRYAGVAGIVFVVLTLVGVFLAGAPPKPDAPVSEWRAFYSDHRTAVLLGVILGGIGSAVVLWFISGLRSVLQRAEGGSGTLAWTAFAGRLATAPASVVGPGIHAYPAL